METKTRRNSDWNANTRLRGLTLLMQGVLLFAVWAAVSLLTWGIETVIVGPQRFPGVLLWAGASGVVLMLAGASMGITGVAVDRITVPSWLNPVRNRLLFQIFIFVILLLVIFLYVMFF
jgi:hypothetical protein